MTAVKKVSADQSHMVFNRLWAQVHFLKRNSLNFLLTAKFRKTFLKKSLESFAFGLGLIYILVDKVKIY